MPRSQLLDMYFYIEEPCTISNSNFTDIKKLLCPVGFGAQGFEGLTQFISTQIYIVNMTYPLTCILQSKDTDDLTYIITFLLYKRRIICFIHTMNMRWMFV
jgi:hypothetical protein